MPGDRIAFQIDHRLVPYLGVLFLKKGSGQQQLKRPKTGLCWPYDPSRRRAMKEYQLTGVHEKSRSRKTAGLEFIRGQGPLLKSETEKCHFFAQMQNVYLRPEKELSISVANRLAWPYDCVQKIILGINFLCRPDRNNGTYFFCLRLG